MILDIECVSSARDWVFRGKGLHVGRVFARRKSLQLSFLFLPPTMKSIMAVIFLFGYALHVAYGRLKNDCRVNFT